MFAKGMWIGPKIFRVARVFRLGGFRGLRRIV